MSLIFDTKEDLHLRMVDLQQKLKESEEERRKLEKTCDALIRAFREDERMHYKALYNQYESFLEDCSLRKKRNDIILKSLCKVEDRAKSLFNKTEKLKLLKDRYTTYLKQNDFLKKEKIKNEADPQLKTSIKGETASKTVHWKTPNLEDVLNHNIKDIHNLNESSKMEAYLEIATKNINNKIFFNSSINDEQNNDLYKFLVRTQNKDVSENYLNYKERVSLQDDNPIKSLYENSNNQNKETKNVSNKIKSEKELSKTCINIENEELVQPIIIRDEDGNFEKTVIYSKEKINDDPTVNNNILNKSFTLENSVFKNIPNASEKTFKDNPDFELKIPNFKPLSTENDQEDKIEKQNFEVKHIFSKSVTDQESFSELKKPTKDYISEKNNLKDLTEDLKHNKSLPEKIVKDNDESNYEVFENDGSSPNNFGSLTVFKKEDTTFSKKIKGNIEEENSEKFKNDTNFELSSNIKIYPKGLDGIDYENETYPDSYYEQPEHRGNMSSIASNVILEEDENELEGDHEKVLSFNAVQDLPTNNIIETNIQSSEKDVEKNHILSGFSLSTLSNQGNSCVIKNEPLQPLASKYLDLEKNNKFPENSIESFQILNDHVDQFRNQDTDSEKSFKQKEALFDLPTYEYQSAKKTSNAESNKNVTRSNLIHLLESDSESFQIEHGEPVSGNEDSDFDFSFKL